MQSTLIKKNAESHKEEKVFKNEVVHTHRDKYFLLSPTLQLPLPYQHKGVLH